MGRTGWKVTKLPRGPLHMPEFFSPERVCEFLGLRVTQNFLELLVEGTGTFFTLQDSLVNVSGGQLLGRLVIW